MPVSPALRRLLRIRQIEEEQSRLALESALGELHLLERALAATSELDRRGRKLVRSSVGSGKLPDRLAGLAETNAASRHAAVLVPRVEEAAVGVAELRQEFLGKRVERRQAETLIEETEARDALDAGRRSQQGIDDWFRSRLHQADLKAGDDPIVSGSQGNERTTDLT